LSNRTKVEQLALKNNLRKIHELIF